MDRNDYLASKCAGQRVLDIGCVDHDARKAAELGDAWLHRRLAAVASSIVGTDRLGEQVAALNSQGFEIVRADAENFDLGEKFDVIVAGDIIEHLSNVGSFLESAKRHMGTDTRLIVTTVNPFDVEQMMQVLLRGHVSVHPDHTMWLDPGVLYHCASRAGLQLTDFTWTRTRSACCQW